ncbi:MAG: peptidase S41 [Bacteroidetes bacterium]|nr:MAG: peptidase S41 [Bacteroidota bacterium]PIE88107.1 MAG: peptidase S41 [Bacteroidota bacterium]
MKKQTFLLFIPLLLLSLTGISQQNNSFEISKNLEIYADVFKQLNNNYVEDIRPGELSKTAIDAMLKTLDPYTIYKTEAETEDFRFMTTGQYGGMGALIRKHGEYVTISEPYKDFPADKAGLKTGDLILAIDGHDAHNLSTEEVSNMLKGEPGTSFEITIKRFGEEKPLTRSINREKIQIDDIPYYGLTAGNIGYINLSSFTRDAASHVKKAFRELQAETHLEGIILDLRGNGGGLLNEAVDIVNLWVDKGELIVSTKGRLAGKSKAHKTRMEVLAPDIPLVILVNEGSASASEITAGAIQDLDRGVIIGTKTFGKGLVQNIVPVAYNSQIKITVAKYYIPSGRCIQAIDYSHDGDDGKRRIPDSLTSVFKTRAGRTVRDGGGIIPDISIEPEELHDITINLITQDLIFDFCTEWFWTHDSIAAPEDFNVSDEIYADFEAFLKKRDFTYETESEKILNTLEEASKENKYHEAIKEELLALQEALKHDKEGDLQKFREEISDLIRIELIHRYYYLAGLLKANLYHDKEIKEAIKIIRDNEAYQQILNP